VSEAEMLKTVKVLKSFCLNQDECLNLNAPSQKEMLKLENLFKSLLFVSKEMCKPGSFVT